MKKVLLATLSFVIFTPLINAQTDKSKYCPAIEEIHPVTKTISEFKGRNAEGKYFSSKVEQPCPNFACLYYSKLHSFRPELTQYNVNGKILSCVYDIQYYERTGVPIGHTELKTLFNIGDY